MELGISPFYLVLCHSCPGLAPSRRAAVCGTVVIDTALRGSGVSYLGFLILRGAASLSLSDAARLGVGGPSWQSDNWYGRVTLIVRDKGL